MAIFYLLFYFKSLPCYSQNYDDILAHVSIIIGNDNHSSLALVMKTCTWEKPTSFLNWTDGQSFS